MRLCAISSVANLRSAVLTMLAVVFALVACSDEAGSATSARDVLLPRTRSAW